jgi:hypothetical protein
MSYKGKVIYKLKNKTFVSLAQSVQIIEALKHQSK